GDQPAATPKVEPRRTLQPLLAKAWELRDRLEDREQNQGWSPIDYAPHLWRELQAQLINFEQKSRAGKAYSLDKLEANLREILKLDDVPRARGGSAVPSGTSIAVRLARARQSFQDSKAKTSYEGSSTDVVDLRRGAQLRNEIVFRAAYYVRWQDS